MLRWSISPGWQPVVAPVGTEFLSAMVIGGELVLFGRGVPSAKHEPRTIVVIEDGEPISEQVGRHVATALFARSIAWHVFEATSNWDGTRSSRSKSADVG